MRTIRFPCTFGWMTLCLWPIMALSQDGTAESPVWGPLNKPYGATIEIQNSGSIAYGDPAFVSVRITPLEDLAIDSIDLLPQGQLAALYEQTKKDENGDLVPKWPCLLGMSDRPERVPFSVSCEIRPAFKLIDYLDPRVALLPSSRHKLLVRVTVLDGADPVEHYEEVFVDVVPPKASVMIGALGGALILSLFLATYRETSSIPADWKTLLAGIVMVPLWLIDVVRSAVLAAICALILILLAEISEGGQPPISLHVQDFWGGVIVGLFSVPLARWIAARLSLSDRPVEPPHPKPAKE
jgi:hypothetical protein